MTKQEFRQFDSHLAQQETHAKRRRLKLREDFINEKAAYPIGSVVKVDNNAKIQDLIIKGYDIDENLLLIPIFETLQGKKVFTYRPTILDLVK